MREVIPEPNLIKPCLWILTVDMLFLKAVQLLLSWRDLDNATPASILQISRDRVVWWQFIWKILLEPWRGCLDEIWTRRGNNGAGDPNQGKHCQHTASQLWAGFRAHTGEGSTSYRTKGITWHNKRRDHPTHLVINSDFENFNQHQDPTLGTSNARSYTSNALVFMSLWNCHEIKHCICSLTCP